MTTEAINLFWMISSNFGDMLSPWLVERISGKQPVYVEQDGGLPRYVTCGSILNWADENCTVWGSGLAHASDRVCAQAQIRSVRGPLSRTLAAHRGATCPEVYGDPALLLPRYYTPKGEKRYELGIVPHFKQQRLPMGLMQGHVPPEVRIVNVLDSVENVIDAIWSCKRIAASALHGIIAAHAYGIPATWIDFGPAIGGDGTKFYDHLCAVGLAPLPPARIEARPDALSDLAALLRLPYEVPRVDLTEPLLAACPFRAA